MSVALFQAKLVHTRTPTSSLSPSERLGSTDILWFSRALLPGSRRREGGGRQGVRKEGKVRNEGGRERGGR